MSLLSGVGEETATAGNSDPALQTAAAAVQGSGDASEGDYDAIEAERDAGPIVPQAHDDFRDEG